MPQPFSRVSPLILSAILALPAFFFAACGEEDAHPPAGSGSSSSGSGTTVGSGSGTTGSGGSSSTSGTGGSGSDLGYCGLKCGVDADCCPAADPNCPGAYPHNWTCPDGICRAPECKSTQDCTLANTECHPTNGFGICFTPCLTDTDCVANLTCTGQADDGAKFCTTTQAGCTIDDDCHGYGKCFFGACRCKLDGDCSAETVDTCVF